MRRLTAILLAACVALAASAANMASQKWVEMKLREINALVNRSVSPMAVDAGTNGTIYATFEPATVATLVATNSANATITNGAAFAWLGNGIYTNAQLGCAIFATQTNFVWNAVQSVVTNGLDTFVAADGFAVKGTYLTPTQAAPIRGR